MHRELGFFVVDRPIGYTLTERGIDVTNDLRAAEAAARRTAAKPRLGRSPAVLPSRKHAAASEPTVAVTTEVPVSQEPESIARCVRDGAFPTRIDPECAYCKDLLRELLAATDAFTTVSKPFVRLYARLSYSQVRDGKFRLESLGKAVHVAKQAYDRHQAVHEARR